jgi:hypothetical protein
LTSLWVWGLRSGCFTIHVQLHSYCASTKTESNIEFDIHSGTSTSQWCMDIP